MTWHNALHPRVEVCQEKKEEEDSPSLRIALMYQNKVWRNTKILPISRERKHKNKSRDAKETKQFCSKIKE